MFGYDLFNIHCRNVDHAALLFILCLMSMICLKIV